MAASAHADNTLWGGRPLIGVSYSQSPSEQTLDLRKILVISPGLSFSKAPIHRAELLIETEQDSLVNQGVSQNASLSRLAIRVRKDVPLSNNQAVRLRAQLGYSHGSNASFFDGESDGALRYQPGALGLMGGLTVRRALDGTRGHDRHALYLGGVLLLESRHEIELRWQRSWDAYRHTKDTDLYSLEYIYQF
jgi:hypothetical protein